MRRVLISQNAAKMWPNTAAGIHSWGSVPVPSSDRGRGRGRGAAADIAMRRGVAALLWRGPYVGI